MITLYYTIVSTVKVLQSKHLALSSMRLELTNHVHMPVLEVNQTLRIHMNSRYEFVVVYIFRAPLPNK
jgi:hypothetical protein